MTLTVKSNRLMDFLISFLQNNHSLPALTRMIIKINLLCYKKIMGIFLHYFIKSRRDKRVLNFRKIIVTKIKLVILK